VQPSLTEKSFAKTELVLDGWGELACIRRSFFLNQLTADLESIESYKHFTMPDFHFCLDLKLEPKQLIAIVYTQTTPTQ